MAGHSQFKNIMYRKGAQDAKKAKIFTKIGREIIAACKSGAPDPASNPRLRSAIIWARQENMPRDRIEGAIKRGTGNIDADNFEPVRYEGYGPGGVAIIVQGLTDNRNRTASELRSVFGKHSGNLGEPGSVSFMFEHIGRITYPLTVAAEEKMFETALEAGADGCDTMDGEHIITCAQDAFASVRDGLEKAFGPAASAKLTWQPKTGSALNEEQARNLMKLVETLDDLDDVQEVFTNAEMTDDILQKLSAA